MFLTSPERTLEISFHVSHEENSYMLYASTDNLRCFECGILGHKRFSCPQKNVDNEQRVTVESTENGSVKDCGQASRTWKNTVKPAALFFGLRVYSCTYVP